MSDGVHVCESQGLNHVNQSDSGTTKQKTDIPYTCGACGDKFTFICLLHVHLRQHCESGSYYFDNCTYTAFPKFDTVCTFTQVNPQDLDIIYDINIEPGPVMDTCIPVSPFANTPTVRKSHRIAVRKEISVLELLGKKTKRKNNYKERDKNNVVAKQMKCEQSEVETAKEKDEVIDRCNKYNLKDNKIIKLLQHQVQKNNPNSAHFVLPDIEKSCSVINQEGVVCGTDSNDYKEMGDDVLYFTKETEVIEEVVEDTSVGNTSCTKDIIRDVQKRDELTASEVLIAMSKGANEITVIKSAQIPFANISTQSEIGDTANDAVTENVENDLQQHPVGQKQSSKAQKKTGNSSKQVECKVCGKVGSKAMLTYHKYLHMEKESFTCDKCGRSFQHPKNLEMHLRQHAEKQFCCDICPASFHRKQYLQVHMLKHTGQNPHMCDLCGKSFRDPNHLKRHIRHVHEKLRDFECDICLEKFCRSDYLKNHRMRHFEADKQCQYCKKMFKHPNDLKRHTMTHTGEKKWYCHLCNHGFVGVSPYYAHMTNKHGMSREEAKLFKGSMHDGNQNLQNERQSEMVIQQTSGNDKISSETGNKYFKKESYPEDGTDDFSFHDNEAVALSETQSVDEIPTGSEVDSVTIINHEQQINLHRQKSHELVEISPPLKKSCVMQREAGCQTSEYERNEAALELMQLQNQSVSELRSAVPLQRGKGYDKLSGEGKKKRYYLFNDVSSVRKKPVSHGYVRRDAAMIVDTEADNECVVQVVDFHGEAEIEMLQQTEEGNQDSQQGTVSGDYVLSKNYASSSHNMVEIGSENQSQENGMGVENAEGSHGNVISINNNAGSYGSVIDVHNADGSRGMMGIHNAEDCQANMTEIDNGRIGGQKMDMSIQEFVQEQSGVSVMTDGSDVTEGTVMTQGAVLTEGTILTDVDTGGILTSGAEMAMLMCVSGAELNSDGIQAVMYIDDNTCASEVVIHVDQMNSL